MDKKGYKQLEAKVELVFETSRLDSKGRPIVVTAHDVPQEYGEAIPRFFDMMNGGEITIDETAYNSRLRGMRKHNPDTKDYLGWMHHKLGPNLGKAGIWGCKLIRQYSDTDSVQRPLFYDVKPTANVTNIKSARSKDNSEITEATAELGTGSPVEIIEKWNTKNGIHRPGATMMLVAINKETGEYISSCELPENHSNQTRDSLAQEAEAILARRQEAAA